MPSGQITSYVTYKLVFTIVYELLHLAKMLHITGYTIRVAEVELLL